LGDSDTAVRIAGVYAMAAAADESPVFARRQQCWPPYLVEQESGPHSRPAAADQDDDLDR
jgi:hypothetical protein